MHKFKDINFQCSKDNGREQTDVGDVGGTHLLAVGDGGAELYLEIPQRQLRPLLLLNLAAQTRNTRMQVCTTALKQQYFTMEIVLLPGRAQNQQNRHTHEDRECCQNTRCKKVMHSCA